MSRASLSLDNSHEVLALILWLTKWLNVAYILVLGDFSFLKAKALASIEVNNGKGTVEGHRATHCHRFAGSLCILLCKLRRFRVALANNQVSYLQNPCSDSSLQGTLILMIEFVVRKRTVSDPTLVDLASWIRVVDN